tara:strand:- start:248 stop:442 length:195 start_codon:yes stop_codon:yes gene_type:complete
MAYGKMYGKKSNSSAKKSSAKKSTSKAFKPHMMYKGGKSVMAKTKAQHLALKGKGYTHTKPKKK